MNAPLVQAALAQATTSDGIRLDGALQTPPDTVLAAQCGVDVFLCVHGTGSNFYASRLFENLSPILLSWGAAVLTVNTRGHDGISTQGARRLGSTFEIVDECRYDLLAWLYFLRDQGYSRVAVLGHSLGAAKAIYALGQLRQSVHALLALSPPRLSHDYFLQSARGEEFAADLRRAQEEVAGGRPEALLDVRFPLPYIVTAASYVDKYGLDERYNLLRHLPGMKQPTFVTFGSIEVEREVAFQGLPEDIGKLAATQPNLSVATIAGGDHLYRGVHGVLAERIGQWLGALA